MSRHVTLGILLALIAGHILLASVYASITPYRQAGIVLGQRDPKTGGPQRVTDVGAPDERPHVNYVIYLLSGKGFPTFSPTDPNLGENLEFHQPPAFYLLAAEWCKLLGATNLEDKDSGVKLRYLNALIGGGTVTGVFFLAFWGFRRPEVALAAAAVAAFLPMSTALSGAVSNDPLLILLCTWVLAFCARGLRDGWSWKLVAGIGILTGLAFMTKTTALALAPILLLVAFLPGGIPAEKRYDSLLVLPKPSIAMIAATAGIALLIAGPWWARNQEKYGDLFAIKSFNQAFSMSPHKSAILQAIEFEEPGGSSEITYWKDWVGWWTARSFFGAFGYMDIWLNETGRARGPAQNTLYRMLIVVTGLCFLGWAISLGKDEWRETRSIQIMNGAFLVIVILLFAKFNMEYFQAQGRYIYPALGPIACGFAIGADQLLGKAKQFALPLLAVIFLGVNLYALSQLPDAFSKRIETQNRLG